LERLEDRRLLAAITFSAGILTLNGDQDFAGENDNFALARDAGDPTKLDVTVNSNTAQYALNSITQINVYGFAGDDSLQVDSSNGLIGVPNGISFDGGTGVNSLTLEQTAGPSITFDNLYVGASPGAGESDIQGGTTLQFVAFQNIEPFFDNVPSPTFNISNSTDFASLLDGNNAINYTPVQEIVNTVGVVTIDNFEPITFSYKDHLSIDAGAGDDTININGGATPNGDTAAGLQDITIDGNDPTASDTLIVNGTSGSDTIDYRPSSTIGSGEVDVNSNPAVLFNTIESVTIDGQGGDDNLTYTSPSNAGAGNVLTFTPGDVVDTATVTGRQYGGDALVPLTYQNIGAFGTLTFQSVDEGRSDYLDVYGTAASDQFNLDPDDGGSLDIEKLDQPNNVSVTVEISTPSISTLALHGLDGDDQFNVVCMENNQVALPYDNLIIDGGDPSASDIVNLINPSGPVVVDLGNDALSTNTTIAGYGGTITLQGDEVVNFNLDGQTLKVNGTSQPENITYTPTDTNAGTFTVAGLNTTFNFSGLSSSAGALVVDPGTPGTGAGNTVTVVGTSGDDNITASATSTSTTSVQVNSLATVTLETQDTQSLVIDGGTGNDTLTVDSTTEAVVIPITYDGGPGTNTLVLTGGTETGEQYTPGSQLGSGTISMSFVSGTELINFLNLAPIVDSVSGPLTVYGTNADNAINYTAVVNISNIISHIFVNNPLVFAEVSVDSYEPIIFTNKTSLTINSLAGDDVVNLDDPTTPTGMSLSSGITVNGGDPTASDTLIVNGILGTADHFVVVPTAIGSGQVSDLSSAGANQAPVVMFTGIEALNIVGQATDADSLAEGTPAQDELTVNPGSDAFSGTITGYQNGGFNFFPVTYSGIAGFVAPATGLYNPTTDQSLAAAIGGSDAVTIDGTSADDTFSTDTSFNASVLGIHVGTSAVAHTVILLDTGNSNHVGILSGLGGNDTFNLGSWVTNPNSILNLHVEGGDSDSSSDTINYTANTSAATTVDLGAGTINSTAAPQVTYTGVEHVNVSSGNGTVTVDGTAGADSLAVTPTSFTSATLQNYTGGTAQNGQGGTLATMTSLGPAFNFTNVSTATGGFTISGNGGSDQLFIEGTQNADTIDVNDAASGTNAVKVGTSLIVNYTNTMSSPMAHVEIDALAGSDTINIAPSATTTFLVDGGDPIGVLPGDTINLIHPAGFYQIFQGPTKDSGGLNTPSDQTISWIHIETVINTGGTPIITGTNGNDQITIIARDSSYNPANPGTPNPLPGLDGVQDFTVSVNDGPDMLFVNTPNLLVDSEAGNDDIDVQEPAPNNAAWNVQIWVAGGTPSAGVAGLGDTVELETPGTQNVTYAPDVAAPALAGVTFGPNSPTDTAQFHDTTNTSAITAVSLFTIAGFYQSSPGGVEQFVYQGDAGNDNLTYLTPNLSTLSSVINYTPGATADSGTITATAGFSGTFVPLSFQGLGVSTNTITFSTSNPSNGNRGDRLTVNGTAGNDDFFVSGSGDAGAGAVQVTNTVTTETLLINTPGIDRLDLNGLGGVDVFNVTGSLPYGNTYVEGSDPIVNLSGATGAVGVLVGNTAIPSSNTLISGYGGQITLIGIDTANIDASNAAHTIDNTVFVTGTSQPESFVYTPTGTNAGTLTDSGMDTVFNFSNVSGTVSGFTLDPFGGSDTVTVNGTSSADSQTALVNGSDTTVRTNGLLAVDTVTADTESLVIASGNGDDQLTVDASNGPVTIPLVYDGGTGRDTLQLTGGTASTDAYTPGPTPGSGRSQIVFTNGGGGSQIVNFVNLEPVQDDVVATTATVNADNAANAINYSQGGGFNDHTHTGLVTVDNQETYEFTNKTHLVLNALNGSDEINLNNPDTPTALTDITVNGGDPTASDTLIVNGTTGTDAINYSPSTVIGSGTVQVNALPTVFFTTIEQLKIDGQGGADNLTLTTPAGNDNVIYTPGPTPDSGSMSINAIAANGVARVPVSFTHIGGSVTFASAGGREDNVDILGTNNSDIFTANGPADTVLITDRTTFNPITETLHTGGASILQLSGLGGDDVFNAIGLMQYSLILDGGDPSGSDTANLSGATGLVTVNMLNPAASSGPTTLTTITGYTAGMGAVFLTGVEVANLDTHNFGLTVNGNSSPNLFTYTPTGPAAGTFSESGINTVFNFTNTVAAFTINGSAGSTADMVTLEGSASRDLISIDQGARTASVTNVANTLLKTVTLGANIQVLTAQGLSGQDTFLVTPAPGTQFPQSIVNPVGGINNLLIDIDGGSGGSGENNALVIATQTGTALPNTDFVVVNRGADNNSGTVRTFGAPATPGPQVQYPDINYVNIQTVSPNVGTDQNAGPFLNQPNLLILGPDLNEPNQNPVNGNPFNATFLGSGPTINVQNAAIFPNNTEFPFVPADQDYYRVVAQNSGTLDFQVYFNLFDPALFPAGGNLNIQVLDVNGNVIATGAPANFGSVGTSANARIRIPVVQGQTYYLRVFGANVGGTANPAVVNGYNMTIVNTPLVAPGAIELSESVPNGEPNAPLTTQGTPDTGQLPSNAPPSDSGRSQFDNVTNGGFNSTAAAAAAAAASTSGTLPAPAGSTLGKPTIYITLDDSFLLQDIPGNQTPGGVPGTSPIPINFNSSTTLVPTFANAPINGSTFNGNYRIAVYDDGNGAMSQQPGTSNNPSTGHTLPGGGGDSTFIGFAEPVPAVDPVTGLPIPGQFVPHLYMLTIGSQGGATGNGTGALASDTLDDGVHNITARVQIIEPSASTNPIKTAFGPRSQSLQITIDTVAPAVMFGFGPGGGGGLTPGSDSGVVTEPETSSDLVTNVTAPTFQGLAEANSIVYLYAQITNPANPNFGLPFPQGYVFLGETVAIPTDGTNAFPNGQWQLTSTVDLNNPTFFLRDGLRTIVATAEDLAGNKAPTAPFGPGQTLQIEIDTQGPQVTDVVISDPTIAPSGTDGENLNYNLFSEKFGTNSAQAQQGPTPLVYAITINLQDLPVRVAQFLSELAFKPEVVEGQEIDDSGEFADGGISLIGDANGRIAFTVVANPLDSPPDPNLPNTTTGAATGEVQLRFKDANGNPIALPDDRYTLTINDTAIVDPAGNKLDGESDAAEPLNNPNFPSGNGIPGGNFTARFTVDSRPELGDFAAARVYIDANGNFIYDPQNTDFTNRDLTFTMQVDPNLVGIAQLGIHDSVFVGKFAAPGSILPPTGYFSKLAAYGTDPIAGSGFRWLIDTDGDGLADMYVPQPVGFSLTDQNGQSVTFAGSGIAIAGEFDGNTADGDEVGLFDGSHFWLDTNHDFKIDAGDTVITTQLRGYPIVGDFNGDGTVDLGTWQTDVFQFNFGVTGTGGNSGTPAQFSGTKDATINWGFPGVGEIPLAADMDGDGITDIGLWVPGRAGTVPEDTAEEFFLMSNDFNATTGLPNNTGLTDPNAAFQLLNHSFSTVPLGHDLYANLLDEFATPIVGNFDPPLSPVPSSVDPAIISADITPPTSTVAALPTMETSPSFTVNWSGTDNSGGSGIANFDVYVSDNGGHFTSWLQNTTSTSATFNGVNGHSYSFLSVATDNSGNVQDTPTAAQTGTHVQVQVQATSSTTLGVSAASIVAGQSVTFTATVTGNMGVPTGTVTFKDGTSILSTITLVNGVAIYTNSTFATGNHSITAAYNPVAPNVTSVSSALLESVTTPAAPPPPPPSALTFNGTSGNDIITIMPANATGSITVLISNATTNNKATSLGTFVPTGTIYINGLAGKDTLQISTATIGGKVISVTAPISFSGGDGIDTLLASNIANVWAITGLNSGTLNGNSFNGIENLTGGASTDAYRFSARGSVSGKVTGGAGANSLDYSAYGSPATVSLQTNTATGTGGIATIQSIVGSSGSTFAGPNVASNWNITGTGSGTVGTFSFTGMSNLTGGSSNDTFTLANGAGVSGKIDGGAGIDTLKYAYTSAVTVNLATSTATGVGSIANLEGMVGGSSTSDTLVGPNTVNAWTVSAANTGKVNAFTFSGVENLTGGSANDNFVLGKAIGVAGHIDGGAGLNMLDYAAYATAVNVNLATGTATNIGQGVSNITVVRGGSSNDFIVGDGGNDILIGGAGNDTLTAGGGRDLLFGGLGADILNGGSGESILISGTTKFDTNLASIDSLLAYWSRTDLTNSARVAALRAGSVAGIPALNASNVLNDTSADTLNGGAGLDWFFAKLGAPSQDTITGLDTVDGDQTN